MKGCFSRVAKTLAILLISSPIPQLHCKYQRAFSSDVDPNYSIDPWRFMLTSMYS